MELAKWYLDVVTPAGAVVIAYAATLSWRSSWGARRHKIAYNSVLSCAPGATSRTRTHLGSTAVPELAGERAHWQLDALELAGEWTRTAPPVERVILDRPDGQVVWRCHMPGAFARVCLSGETFTGHGYLEYLTVTMPPWRLPIDVLLWGRALAEDRSVVWIDWRGEHSFGLLLVDGAEVPGARFEPDGVRGAGCRVRFEDRHSLREGRLVDTVLAGIVGLGRRFPTRGLLIEENKWLSRVAIATAEGESRGFAIHEQVKW